LLLLALCRPSSPSIGCSITKDSPVTRLLALSSLSPPLHSLLVMGLRLSSLALRPICRLLSITPANESRSSFRR
ncbi:hypothetical protein PMAYCL1PPCAC_05476, partial [Pristionchus mayeri]